MMKVNRALELAARGFHVFPLVPDSKVPLIKDFPNMATTDPKKIKEWWDRDPDANIGISTTRYNGSGALLAVDVDNKNGVNGDDTLFTFDMEGKSLPPTITQHTPTGGKHLLYYAEKAVSQSAGKLGAGLDIRSNGGYVVGAGSTLGDRAYTVGEGTLAPAPQWLVDQCGEATPKTERAPAVEGLNQEFAMARAKHYLSHEAPPGVEGTRNHTAFTVAAKIKDFGVSEGECYGLMSEKWNCEPALDAVEMEAVIGSAYKNGTNPPGTLAPEAVFTPITEPSPEKHYLEKINDEYALLFEDGGHVVMFETTDEQGEKKIDMMPEASFNRKFSTKTVQRQVGKRLVETTHSKDWLNWQGRREYRGLCFSPGRDAPKGFYNLWYGFNVKPLPYADANELQRAGFDAFIEHAKQNVAGGNEDHFNWVIGYFAHMIQRPFEKPLTALVFQGRKGTGKNALVERVGHLLGKHFLVVDDPRYLTSNFNGHMDSRLMLVLDEAFWSGDKSAEGKLKGLITGKDILIERKGKEAYRVRNLVRLIIIGNEEWLVPASSDERRYAVFQMGEGRMQQGDFFEDMRVNLEKHEGSRVLLHYLMNFDLSKVNVNVAPKTEGLLRQQFSSSDKFGKWWHECLVQGHIHGSEWTTVIDKCHLAESYQRYCKNTGHYKYLKDNREIGNALRVQCPSARTDTKRRSHEDSPYVKTYTLPDLETARKEWAEKFGQEIDWSKQ